MKNSSHHSGESVYKLHIGAKPSVPAKRVFLPKHPIDLKHRESSSSERQSGRKVWLFIWDKIKFLLVSVFVFAIIYVALNWQAIEMNIVHYWNVWRGFKSPLEKLVTEKPNTPEKLPVESRTTLRGISIPPLAIEVYPPDMRLVIPRINQNVPVIGVKNENLIARKWDQLESDIQKALRNGVIHYPGTKLPGEDGNIVITGHSSYYAWDPGRFKDVFALLHDVRQGDRIVVYFNQKKYIYEVSNIKVVLPKDVDILGPSKSEQLTLITCTPIGTNLKRLIVTAKLVEKS